MLVLAVLQIGNELAKIARMVITNIHASASEGVRRGANCRFSGSLVKSPYFANTMREYAGQDSDPAAFA